MCLCLNVYMCAWMCICAHVHAAETHRGQKRMLDPLELELQAIISYCMDTGNQIWVLKRLVKVLNCWAISSAHIAASLILPEFLPVVEPSINSAFTNYSCSYRTYYFHGCLSNQTEQWEGIRDISSFFDSSIFYQIMSRQGVIEQKFVKKMLGETLCSVTRQNPACTTIWLPSSCPSVVGAPS